MGCGVGIDPLAEARSVEQERAPGHRASRLVADGSDEDLPGPVAVGVAGCHRDADLQVGSAAAEDDLRRAEIDRSRRRTEDDVGCARLIIRVRRAHQRIGETVSVHVALRDGVARVGVGFLAHEDAIRFREAHEPADGAVHDEGAAGVRAARVEPERLEQDVPDAVAAHVGTAFHEAPGVEPGFVAIDIGVGIGGEINLACGQRTVLHEIEPDELPPVEAPHAPTIASSVPSPSTSPSATP